MATEEVVTVSLPQVIDLALNSPEIGAVNFNLLHNLLHIMAQQLSLTGTNVEFHGKDGELVKLLLQTQAGRINPVLIHEYTVKTDNAGGKTKAEVSKTAEGPLKTPVKGETEGEVVVWVQPDPSTPLPHLTVCMNSTTVSEMQNQLVNLKGRMEELLDLPKNSSILNAIKNKDEKTPVGDMFQLLTLVKRVDAAETGLLKLGSIVEDLTGEVQYAQLQIAEVSPDGGQYGDFEDGAESPKSPKSGRSPSASRPQTPRPQGKSVEAEKGASPNVAQKGSPASKKSIQKSLSGIAESANIKDGVDAADNTGEVVGDKEGVDQTGVGQTGVDKQTQNAQRVGSIAIGEGSQNEIGTQKGEKQVGKSERASLAKSMDNERRVSNEAGAKTIVAKLSKVPSTTSDGRRSPPELVIRIGNSEKRLQAIEDTLVAHGIPPQIIPMMKYPSRIDLPAIKINKALIQGAPSPMSGPSGSPVTPEKVDPTLPTPDWDSADLADSPEPFPLTITTGKQQNDVSRLASSDAVVALQKDINKIKKEIRKMKSMLTNADDSKQVIKGDKKRAKKQGTDDAYGELDAKLRDSADTLVSMDQNFNNQILALQNQYSMLEKDVNSIMEKLSTALPGGDTGVESIGDLFKKMQGMQIDIENIAETTAGVVEDMTTRKSNFESLIETVELLKTIKADKEDLEDALADKADKCAINRKVSHDQFDTACDELSRGIEEALEKLTNQELLWQQALDEIQYEISNKLDKMELGPLRDFINNKLRMLQERMKSLTALKKEQEAAGTKSKFLRNVNCISCDKDVVMRKQMDASLMPQPRSMPPNRSMAPYLAYELDTLRKQQKTLANSRNLNDFESAITGGKSPRMDDHVCNRYCGGSHTVTTPQQRVTRMGHFLAQWGPGAVPATDTVPTKDESKPEKRLSAVEAGATGDLKKTTPPEPGAEVTSQQDNKGSIKSAGPGGDETKSPGSPEKVGSIRGSQGSVKRGSKTSATLAATTGSLKGSVNGSIKGSKQILPQGSKDAVTAVDGSKQIPAEIPEETPSEVAEAELPAPEGATTPEAAVAPDSPLATGDQTQPTAGDGQERKASAAAPQERKSSAAAPHERKSSAAAPQELRKASAASERKASAHPASDRKASAASERKGSAAAPQERKASAVSASGRKASAASGRKASAPPSPEAAPEAVKPDAES